MGRFAVPSVAALGFVRPNSATGADGKLGNADSDVPDDVFVPPGSTAGAMEGDTVEVKISPGRRGGIEGVVTSILQRGRRQYAATYFTKIRDGRPGVVLDGVPFEHPIGVGDIRGLPIENNDKVFVELVEFPRRERPGRRSGNPGAARQQHQPGNRHADDHAAVRPAG